MLLLAPIDVVRFGRDCQVQCRAASEGINLHGYALRAVAERIQVNWMQPLALRGCGTVVRPVPLRGWSEDDGTRTRNHRIDSPVL